MDTLWFDTYDECKTDFINRSKRILRSCEGSTFEQWNDDDEFPIHATFVPGKPAFPLLILVSGVHGIEGFAGSAFQRTVLEKLPGGDFSRLSFLFIHGINGYGFQNFIRVTKKNVDLNRNAMFQVEDFQIQNPDYRRFRSLLQPTGPAGCGWVFALSFLAKLASLSFAYGNKALLRAVMSGQYEESQGIFFGGNGMDDRLRTVMNHIDRITDRFPFTLVIDLHTGYGKKGALHLFPNQQKDPARKKRLEQVFKNYKIQWGGTGNFYSATGDFAPAVQGLSNQKKVIDAMVFEFGTCNNHRLPGSLIGLYFTVLENQGRNQGFASKRCEKRITHKFSRMFYPDQEEWKRGVIRMGLQAIMDASSQIEKLHKTPVWVPKTGIS